MVSPYLTLVYYTTGMENLKKVTVFGKIPSLYCGIQWQCCNGVPCCVIRAKLCTCCLHENS